MELGASVAAVSHEQIALWAQPSKAGDLQHLVHAATGTELSGAHAISPCAHRAALIYCSQ